MPQWGVLLITGCICFLVFGLAVTGFVSHAGWVERKVPPIFFGGAILIALAGGIIGGKGKAGKVISIGWIIWTAISFLLAFYYDHHVEW